MAARTRILEPLAAAGLRGDLLALIAAASARLAAPGALDADGVHEARKALRSARGTLRVLRPAIGRVRFQRANRALRDAGRTLRAARDSAVLLGTFTELGDTCTPSARRALLPVRRQLARERRGAQLALRRAPLATRAARQDLAALQRRIRRWPLAANQAAGALSALQRAFRKSRAAGAAARRHPSDACLHEWRKQTKFLVHHLHWLQGLRPRRLGRQGALARSLSQYLGQDRDLALLSQKLRGPSAQAIAPPLRRQLLARIVRRRMALQRSAFSLGRELHERSARGLFGAHERAGGAAVREY